MEHSKDIGHRTIRMKPLVKPRSRRMFVKPFHVARQVAIAVVYWGSADIDVAEYDDFPVFFLDELADTLLEQEMIVHLERQTRI